MHMSDPFLSVPVGIAFWGVSAAVLGKVCRTLSRDSDSSKVPLTGVVAAFVFAAQMINFSIPGTGSSGHLGGGLLLAVLLGPHRAFLAMASVLVVQCLLFADGGILALGCNIFNLAVFPAYVAFPLIYRPLSGVFRPGARSFVVTVTAAVVGLLLGASFVVFQVFASAKTDIPIGTFFGFMLPIHLAIGVFEGVATWGVLSFLHRAQPGLLPSGTSVVPSRRTFLVIGGATALVAGLLSWFASEHPDGLEWALERAGMVEPAVSWSTRAFAQLAVFPDYGIPSLFGESTRVGLSLAGLSGASIVLFGAAGLGIVLRRFNRPSADTPS